MTGNRIFQDYEIKTRTITVYLQQKEDNDKNKRGLQFGMSGFQCVGAVNMVFMFVMAYNLVFMLVADRHQRHA